MSGVFCLCCCVCSALYHHAAATHLHRGVGELALVRGLQRGQRRDFTEDHSVQRTHCLSHHQGGAAQRCPEAGTSSFQWHAASLCLYFCHIFIVIWRPKKAPKNQPWQNMQKNKNNTQHIFIYLANIVNQGKSSKNWQLFLIDKWGFVVKTHTAVNKDQGSQQNLECRDPVDYFTANK